MIIGPVLVLIPVLFGSFVEGTELASFEDEEAQYFIRPMTRVESVKDGEENSHSQVTGILMVHLTLLIAGMVCLISTHIGARIVAIIGAITVILSLLLLFIFIPNIMFVEGGRMVQFDSDHLLSLSGGWFSSMAGGLLFLTLQFIKKKN